MTRQPEIALNRLSARLSQGPATAAYSAEIFHGALRSIPKGDLDAAEACGITGWQKVCRVQWPAMLRLARPAYTNEAIPAQQNPLAPEPDPIVPLI